MDWEKYTGKKNVGSRDGAPIDVLKIDTSKNIDYSITLPPGKSWEDCEIVFNGPTSYPSFDEVWETVQSKLENRAYDDLPMQQAIVAMVKDAARVMYEALTPAQDTPRDGK